MSGTMLFIQEDLNASDKQTRILAGILNACAVIGSLTARRISDMIDCRYTIIVGTVIFLVGSVLMSFGLNFAMLLSDRYVTGIDVRYVLMIAPVYSTVISSTSSRSFLSSPPKEICINLGILSVTLPTSISASSHSSTTGTPCSRSLTFHPLPSLPALS
ncbi:putative polyol transporter 3 [Curcuma longa]|uniref:putative polyol transporter 3 n=1 Tax=Curcuma longa TaxID=136217 RepID=UPI003D9E9AFE